jgi:hypothetical protein
MRSVEEIMRWYSHIEKYVSIRISDVVAHTAVIVRHHIQAPRIKHSLQIFNQLLRLRARNLRPDGRTVRLAGIECFAGCILVLAGVCRWRWWRGALRVCDAGGGD